jgi:hypothetical protein
MLGRHAKITYRLLQVDCSALLDMRSYMASLWRGPT